MDDLFYRMHMANDSRQPGAGLDRKSTSATKTSVSREQIFRAVTWSDPRQEI